ncbi:MAG: glycerol-3-phosphate dehydrogenase subunit GlpB [Rikenellaceae bacterium]|nr:glycerol-3-phosphate dehydrogenase subunit GlpB [Rikenellaceae bacterium]
MKFDTIIIGGGLSGLVTGISLAEAGQKCLIISAGQSALHFFSGSFELYGCDGAPLESIAALDATHPYSKLGVEQIGRLAEQVPQFFERMNITLRGSALRNHYRLTPLGVLKPAWLTMDEYVRVESADQMPWSRVAICDIAGFLDFQPDFLASGLAGRGVESKVVTISLPELERLRNNPTEMRATNIAKVLSDDVLVRLAQKINDACGDVDAVLMPTVVGLLEGSAVEQLRRMVDRPVQFVATMPPSVPGIRTQITLRKRFQELGGVYMLGDTAKSGTFDGDRLTSIRTANHGAVEFEADNFVLASGSFFSHGIVASPEHIYEPTLGLDVDAAGERSEWYERNLFKAQPYMTFGVSTDSDFRVRKEGQTLSNVYAVGAVLSGCNPIKEGCGAGVAILTSMHVAHTILK